MTTVSQWQIATGQKYYSRYRFIVYDGPPDREELERLWNDYANPLLITISVK